MRHDPSQSYRHAGMMATATTNANDICKRVGRRIRDLRQARDWSQQLLADHAQIERAHLSRLEDGRREAGLRVLEKIANALEVDVVELLRR